MSKYTKKRLLGKIQSSWPDVNSQEIMDFLDQYGLESYEKEQIRVQLAILKLCQSDQSRLPELVKTAKTDYREVLAWAEYPEEIKLGYVKLNELPAEEVKNLRRRDQDQYLKWLKD